MEIHEALKRFREDKNISQRQVAEKMSITYQQWQQYEYGKQVPSAKFIVNLAKTFEVTTDYLLGLTDEPNPPQFDMEEIQKAFALRDALKSVMSKGGD